MFAFTMTHIDFVSQSPWPLMAVSIGATAIYFAIKFMRNSAAPTTDCPHQEIPQRDVPHAHFNEWQKHIRKETRKCAGYYRGKGGRK